MPQISYVYLLLTPISFEISMLIEWKKYIISYF